MGACCSPQGTVTFDSKDDGNDDRKRIMTGDGTDDYDDHNPPSINSIRNYCTLFEWQSEIISTEDVVIVYDINDEYENFINKLLYPTQWKSPFYISSIIRIIHHYIGKHLSSLLCKKESQFFNRITFSPPIISINPINGIIYIADEYAIYYLDETDNKNMDEKRLKLSCQIPNYYDLNHDVRITNISFNCNGKSLFAQINNNLDKIYYVDLIKNGRKKIYFNKVYDKSMDILKYNFNGYYLTSKWLPQFFLEVVNTIIPNKYRAIEINDAYNNQNSLYQLDLYRKYLWILQNNQIDDNQTQNDDKNASPIYSIQPTLYKIPIDYANGLRQIKQLQMDRILKRTTSLTPTSLSSPDNNDDDDDNEEFLEKRDILENKLQIASENGEIINLKDILKLESDIYITAFDIDRYYQSLYFITNENILYRIEYIDNDKYNDTKLVRKKGMGNMAKMSRRSVNAQSEFYENSFDINKNWTVTHKLILSDILNNGLPSGKYTMCYDSVNGRLIIASNYKIQAVYI